MNDLLKKLQELGLNIDRGSNIEVEFKPKTNVDNIVEGEWFESNNQRIFLRKKLYQSGYHHGRINLASQYDPKDYDEIWGTSKITDLKLTDFLFLDTETSSLNLGSGALVFLFGCCFFGENGFEILQVFIEDPSQEPLFLSYLDNWLTRFKCLVSYNGKSFDIPVLRTRFVLNRIPPSIQQFKHIDLLHTARRIWKYDLDSKKLSDIEQKILEFQRNEDEIPGWLVPQIYQDYVQNGIADPLKGVFYHNEIDVVSLAALFLLINQKLSMEDFEGNENISIGEIYKRSRKFQQADRYFKNALENNPDNHFKEKILMNFAYSLKNQERLIEMCEIWEQLAENGNLTACVELAKYYEHHKRDYQTAVLWTNTALNLAGAVNDWSSDHYIELTLRLDRLQKKIKKENSEN